MHSSKNGEARVCVRHIKTPGRSEVHDSTFFSLIAIFWIRICWLVDVNELVREHLLLHPMLLSPIIGANPNCFVTRHHICVIAFAGPGVLVSADVLSAADAPTFFFSVEYFPCCAILFAVSPVGLVWPRTTEKRFKKIFVSASIVNLGVPRYI